MCNNKIFNEEDFVFKAFWLTLGIGIAVASTAIFMKDTAEEILDKALTKIGIPDIFES